MDVVKTQKNPANHLWDAKKSHQPTKRFVWSYHFGDLDFMCKLVATQTVYMTWAAKFEPGPD